MDQYSLSSDTKSNGILTCLILCIYVKDTYSSCHDFLAYPATY